jgi:hypothetical protein
MPEKNDSLIASLQGLLWSAIIGVASFQIIAPNVWGYIHDALAIPYKTAYWIFTLCYFLSLPVYLLVWLLFNQISFRHHGKILWFLFVFICLQSLGMLITLRWHFPEWFFIGLFVVYAVCCGLLLVFYAKAHGGASFTSISAGIMSNWSFLRFFPLPCCSRWNTSISSNGKKINRKAITWGRTSLLIMPGTGVLRLSI